MKLTKARLDLGPDYTSSPLTVGDRWLTWPDQGTPPTLDPSTLQIASITTESSLESPAILKIPTLKGTSFMQLTYSKIKLEYKKCYSLI